MKVPEVDATLTYLARNERVALFAQKQNLAKALTLHSVQGKFSQGVVQVIALRRAFLHHRALERLQPVFCPGRQTG